MALLSVPLLYGGQAIGTLSVYTGQPYSFSNEQVHILSALAELSAIAIENAAVAAGKKLPTRAAVTAAVRGLKDYKGITGTINFNAKGDVTKAKYFVIQVISPDPNKWSSNKIDKTLEIAPPQ